ncbi:MAG: acyclic terpene utilization AtuA family protein [Proteobacteria bacterium]|nr:acyclic terpene utilization AtuA family protein [Pseudomonadota bacterium]
MAEIRVVAPTGVLGSGFLESSYEEALRRKPDFVGCDAGSTDPGPYYLGSGKTVFPRHAIKRDLRLMLRGARRLGVPLLIGSCGTAGGDAHLAFIFDITKEIAAEEHLAFTVALIHAEQRKDYLKAKLRAGKIRPLHPAPRFDEAAIERSERIVGMMGAEPFLKALDAGADVVLAGRASDTAIFAGIPIREGFPAGLAWHAAKILECGAASVVQRTSPDCMMATLRPDHFVVEPLDPKLRCTPQSIAAHSLYENAHPFLLVESSGALDLGEAEYEALDARSVRVRGSRFRPAETYTVKLEGAELAGYQSVLIGSVRDRYIIRQIDAWLERLRVRLKARIADVFGQRLGEGDYAFGVRIYGKDGTMGPLEPVKEIRSHELCLVFEVTAPTQDLANAIASMTRHQALHLPIPEWSGLITTLACPYNPAYLERGPVYRFNVNHVVEPDDPYEMFPMEVVRVG